MKFYVTEHCGNGVGRTYSIEAKSWISVTAEATRRSGDRLYCVKNESLYKKMMQQIHSGRMAVC